MFGLRAQDAVEEASAIIAREEGLDVGDVLTLAEVILASAVFPPIIPFVVAGMVIAAPFGMISAKLKRSRTRMPNSWFVTVAATASADGKFFVGRLLDEKGHLTHVDAVRFIAIEGALNGVPEAQGRKSIEESIADLVQFYRSNRSLFDKTVGALAMGAGVLADGAGNVLRAGLHKLKVGF